MPTPRSSPLRNAPAGSVSLNILLADSHPVQRLVATRLLEKLGHRVTLVANGRQVLQALDDGLPDLVMLALQMPVLDGLATTRAVREREARSSTRKAGSPNLRLPVVAMTALASPAERESALAAGADACLDQPIDSARLGRLLELVCALPQGRNAHNGPEGARDFDASRLLEQVDTDWDLIERIAALFKTSSSRHLHNLVQALERGQLEEAEFAAHGLRGTLSMLGASQASELAQQIETATARQDAASANALLPLFEQAVGHVSRVMDSATMR